MTDPGSGNFGIQTAARRTGLSTHTLRVWEQRHGAVDIARSAAGQRRYTLADLERLRLLKRLVDCGERIGLIAGYSNAELTAQLAALGASTDQPAPTTGRLAAWGASIQTQLAALDLELALIGAGASLEDFVAHCCSAKPDLILIELDRPSPRKVALLKRLRLERSQIPLGIVYGFARKAEVAQLRDIADTLRKAPADLEDLLSQLQQLRTSNAPEKSTARPNPRPELSGGAPQPRHYSNTQLAALARQSSQVGCECPAHLVQLVQSLLAFERYSATCVQDMPADAALHLMLLQTTAQARSLLEQALVELAAAEGIDVPAG